MSEPCDPDESPCKTYRALDAGARGAMRTMQAEIELLRAALEFYRDPVAWKKLHDPDNDIRVPDFYSETSFGDTADAALGYQQNKPVTGETK